MTVGPGGSKTEFVLIDYLLLLLLLLMASYEEENFLPNLYL